MQKQILDAEELERYNRHIILDKIGQKGQEKIKQAKILVVGAGGLGSPVLRYLTAAGVGLIGIVDDDVVSESNLQRQILYDTQDIGTSKVSVAKQKLSALNPHTQFLLYKTRFLAENAKEIAQQYDIIIDCTDNYEARYTIDRCCRDLGIPMIYGAIFQFEGQVAVFNLRGGISYDLIFPEAPPANESKDALGVVGVLPGVIGSLQANEALKIILGIGEPLSNRMLIVDLLKSKFEVVRFI